MCWVQNERDVIEVFSLQMPCIFEGVLQNEKVLRVIGTLFGSGAMGLSFARVSVSPRIISCGHKRPETRRIRMVPCGRDDMVSCAGLDALPRPQTLDISGAALLKSEPPQDPLNIQQILGHS